MRKSIEELRYQSYLQAQKEGAHYRRYLLAPVPKPVIPRSQKPRIPKGVKQTTSG